MKTKEVKQIEAKSRQEERDSRTIEQQIKKLDAMFGPGQGAAKERAKLAKRLEEAKGGKKPEQAQPTAEAVAQKPKFKKGERTKKDPSERKQRSKAKQQAQQSTTVPADPAAKS